MGVFQNVPNAKYKNLRPEDKKSVDDYRKNADNPAKNFGDVVSRDNNKSVEKSTTRRNASSR